MKLFISEIQKAEDSYRVCNAEGHSMFKGTKAQCDKYLKASMYFIITYRSNVNHGIHGSYKTLQEAVAYKELLDAKPYHYINQEFVIEPQEIKGVTTCNRTACQVVLTPGQIWENKVMKANYCPKCANLLNTGPFSNVADPICIIETSGLEEQIVELFQEIKDMHPKDGLNSSRDIQLAHDINAKAALMDKLQDKLRLTRPEFDIRG